ncbi:MAG: hypothetical protein ACYS8Z_21365, partial [Planctomycetota bacterium]
MEVASRLAADNARLQSVYPSKQERIRSIRATLCGRSRRLMYWTVQALVGRERGGEPRLREEFAGNRRDAR